MVTPASLLTYIYVYSEQDVHVCLVTDSLYLREKQDVIICDLYTHTLSSVDPSNQTFPSSMVKHEIHRQSASISDSYLSGNLTTRLNTQGNRVHFIPWRSTSSPRYNHFTSNFRFTIFHRIEHGGSKARTLMYGYNSNTLWICCAFTPS